MLELCKNYEYVYSVSKLLFWNDEKSDVVVSDFVSAVNVEQLKLCTRIIGGNQKRKLTL